MLDIWAVFCYYYSLRAWRPHSCLGHGCFSMIASTQPVWVSRLERFGAQQSVKTNTPSWPSFEDRCVRNTRENTQWMVMKQWQNKSIDRTRTCLHCVAVSGNVCGSPRRYAGRTRPTTHESCGEPREYGRTPVWCLTHKINRRTSEWLNYWLFRCIISIKF